MFVVPLVFLAGVLAWWLAPAPPTAEDAPSVSDADLPFLRLDSLLRRKKTRIIRDEATVRKAEENSGEGIRLQERKLPVLAAKKRAKTWTWSNQASYNGLFAEPPPPVQPSYRDVMDRKGEEIARIIGIDLSFGPTMEAAFNNSALQRAESLYKDKRLDEALKAYKALLAHENLMVRAMAAAWVTDILRQQGRSEEFKAAQANLAVLSAQVAGQAFPDLVKRMGAQSPAVKEAFDKLLGGELIRLP